MKNIMILALKNSFCSQIEFFFCFKKNNMYLCPVK